MNLTQLRAKLAALKGKGSAKVAEYNTLLGQLATLEGAALAEAEAKVAGLEGEIDSLSAEANTLAGSIATEEGRATRRALFGSSSITPPGARPGASTEPNAEGTATGGFASIAEFANAVRAVEGGGHLDPRLAALPAGTMGNTGGSGEGFLVPTDFRDAIWDAVTGTEDLLSLVDSEPTAGNSVRILKDETTPWGSSGVVAQWRGEGDKMDARKFVTKGANVDLHELYAFVVASEELIEDAPRLASRLTTKAGDAIRWAASEAIVSGDGIGKPLGYTQSEALVTVAKEAGQAAGTIVAENVAKMYSRLLPTALGNARWLANSEVLPQLIALKIGGTPIWTPPAAGLASAPGGFLLGRPVQFTDHASGLGEVGDLVLADLKGYYAPTKASGVAFAESMHLLFDRNMRAFRWTFRMGGQPYLSKPVQPAKGAASKSHFVALAAR